MCNFVCNRDGIGILVPLYFGHSPLTIGLSSHVLGSITACLIL